MSGYSGSPIFPAEDPHEPQHPGRRPAPQQPSPHEQPYGATPYEQVPVQPGWGDAQPPPESRFGQIHEKYATTEVPLPPQSQTASQPPQQSWPGDWQQQPAQPQQAQHYQQQPPPAQPQQAQHYQQQPPPQHLPQYTQQQVQQHPQHPQQGWPQNGQGQNHDGRTPGQGRPFPPGEAPAYPQEHAPPAGWQPQSVPGPQQPPSWQQQPNGQGQDPGQGQFPGHSRPDGPARPVDRNWAEAEPTALLPPVPPLGAGGAPHAPQQSARAAAWSQGGEPTTMMPPVPAGAGVTGPPAHGYPTQGPGGAGPDGYAPEAGGWADAPVAYAPPASLRETFATAQPTGPAGSFAPPPPPPLENHAGGSLRKAFASAQPTGPTSPGGEGPTAPAPAPGTVRRTGSPIIDPGIQPAAATLGLALLLALAALLGRLGLVLPVLLLQAVTSAGWFRLNGMWPARQGIALSALAGFTADAAVLAASGGTAPAVLAGTLGGFFLLVLILQIFRPSNPDERFYALTVSASATVMTVLAGCFLAAGSLAHHGWSTGAAVSVGAGSAAVATVVSALPILPARAAFAAGAALGTAAGALLGVLTGVGPAGGLLLGIAAAVCALVGRRVAAYDFPSRFVHLTAGVVLPLACAAPAVLLVGRLLAG